MSFAEALYLQIHEDILNDLPDYEIIENIRNILVNQLPFIIIEDSLVKTYTEEWKTRSPEIKLSHYMELVNHDLGDITGEIIKRTEQEIYNLRQVEK